MSLRAIVEFVVHFDRFRNIDLFRQGYNLVSCRHLSFRCYRLKACLYTESSAIRAVPAGLFDDTRQLQREAPPAELPSAEILDSEQAIVTRGFIIRFIDEIVDLQETGHFRLELETNEVRS